MKPEISNLFGPALEKQVSALLENLGGMTEIIEANFSQIKDILQSQKEEVIKAITREKEEVIKAITQEKNKEISDLKSDVKAKELQIQTLK